jgi:hypothetical protein
MSDIVMAARRLPGVAASPRKMARRRPGRDRETCDAPKASKTTR